MSDDLIHYGTPRHSGRFPFGSGDNAQQRNTSFLGYVADLKKKGMTDAQIAKGMGMKTLDLINKRSLVRAEQRSIDRGTALTLTDKGYSNVEIGKRMGRNESSVRGLLNDVTNERAQVTNVISDKIRDSVNKNGWIDIGVGVERHLNVSRTKLNTAIYQLEQEGYKIQYPKVKQLGTGKDTSLRVLAKPDLPYPNITKDRIGMPTGWSNDGGKTFVEPEPARSVSSKRVLIKYAEEGGTEKDGVVELRRGVEDISLGNSKYAQIRIGVDNTHYMKGMAVYADKIPDGVDFIYNTNKPLGTPPDKVFKPMKMDIDDPTKPSKDNPFGATVRQKFYIDAAGNKQLSSLNIVNEEGDWHKWSKSISSQVLSKQPWALAEKQLKIAYDLKKEEYDEAAALNNPVVKKKLLDALSDDLDSSAVHLKAAGLPRQASRVLLPLPTIKDTEIYAPTYRNGEQVVLVRYPHGGIFEIPQLTVNNRNKEAQSVMGGAKDAVGINSKVAERLSGADFDGDTVIVIPNPTGEIKNSSPLHGLKDFDPKVSYKKYEGMTLMKPQNLGAQMGSASNLITDMTIKGANHDEIARAVRHSMVVIDSVKHELDYKQSHINNGIAELKRNYQGASTAGASTLISRASSKARPGLRKETIDKETGKKVYEYTGETYMKYKTLVDKKTGKTLYDPETGKKMYGPKGVETLKTTTSKKMAEVDDAYTLSSGTPIEAVYATHANKLKVLANESRKEMINTKTYKVSPSARITYAHEVSTLLSNLNIALKNAPLERDAQWIANTAVSAIKQANPNMDKDDIKKTSGQQLAIARSRVGAKKFEVEVTARQWEAIQARAVSNSVLSKILNNADLDKIKQLATPRVTVGISPATKARAKSMLDKGYTQSEVADHLGISTSTLANEVE